PEFTRCRVYRPADVGGVIRPCQSWGLGWIAVVKTPRQTILVRSAISAAWTVEHRDDRAAHLAVDLQLLSTGRTSSQLLEIPLLHEGHELINPAAGLALIRTAVRLSNPVPSPAATRKTRVRIMVVVKGNPHLLEIVLAGGAVGGFPHLQYRRQQ